MNGVEKPFDVHVNHALPLITRPSRTGERHQTSVIDEDVHATHLFEFIPKLCHCLTVTSNALIMD